MASDFVPGDKPTEDERDLIDAIEAGRAWWPEKGLAGAARIATIRAALIRAILVGLEIGDLPSPTGRGTTSRRVEMLPYGLRIQPSPDVLGNFGWDIAPRVSILGALDLSGLLAKGGLPLPPLAIEFCTFDRPVDMAGLSVASLSLKAGRFSALRLSNATINGPLDLSWCGPFIGPSPYNGPAQYSEEEFGEFWPFSGATFEREFENENREKPTGRFLKTSSAPKMPDPERPLPTCILMLDDMFVDGGVNFAASRFVRSKAHPCPFRGDNAQISYAIRLAGTHITGSVDFTMAVVVGSVTFGSADVAETIWFLGSRMIGYAYEAAVDLQAAKIGGWLAVRPNEARFIVRRPELEQRTGFGPSLFVGGIEALQLSAQAVWIGDSVIYSAARALSIVESKIVGSLWLGGFGTLDRAHSSRAKGVINLNGTQVGGSLMLHDFGAANDTEDTVEQLIALNDPFFTSTLGYEVVGSLATYHKVCQLLLVGSSVGNAMQIVDSNFNAWADDEKHFSTALDLWKADIGKSLQISGSSRFRGSIRLNRARVGKLLAIQCEAIETIQTGKNWPTAISTEGADIDGEFRLDMRREGSNGIGTIVGSVKLGGMQVKGDLDLKNFRLQLPPPPKASKATHAPATSLSLEATEISGRLQVENIAFLSPAWSPSSATSHQATRNIIGALIAGADNVSVRALPWLLDYVLIRTESLDRFHHILFDRKDKSGVVLSGQSPPIHDANAKLSRLDFGTENNERERRERGYLAFFCDSVHGDEGSFRLVDKVDLSVVDFDVETQDEAGQAEPGNPPEPIDAVQSAQEIASGSDVNLLKISEVSLGEFKLRHMDAERSSYFATVLYRETLFIALFSVSRDGKVDMIDDRPVGRLRTKPARDSGADRLALGIDGVDFIDFGEELSSDDSEKVSAEASGALTFIEGAGQLPKSSPPLGTVDLRRMRCGFLADDYGRGWAMDERLQLRLFGVHCDMVDPTGGHRASGIMSQFDRATANDRTARRLDWLRLQFAPASEDDRPKPFWRRWHSAVTGWLTGWLRDIDFLPRTWSSRIAVNEDVFAPQPWDMFAMAHMRAGEAPRGRELLKDRKDIEARLLFDRAQQWLGTPLFSKDGVPVQHADSNVRSKRSRGGWFALIALGSITAVLASMVANNGGYGAYAVTMGLLACGVLVVSLIVLVAPWLGKLWALLFRTGFSYGLSVPRALATFAAFIVIGASATHKARTGDWLSTRTVWANKFEQEETIVAGQPVKRLDPDIALVLATGYSANIPEMPPANRQARPMASREPSAPGTVVYALATPCNLGVSSILYAADVFIPVLDLDQEARCSIREEPESDRSYFWWSAAKTIYEILGWIVTSLVILTITGVMRRDMER